MSVIIYSTKVCPFCSRAKQLLDSKAIKYTELLIDEDPKLREEMLAKSNGRKTVPQIFIDELHVGGFDDLKAFNDSGELDKVIG